MKKTDALIIGISNCGKTSLTRRLGSMIKLEALSLDTQPTVGSELTDVIYNNYKFKMREVCFQFIIIFQFPISKCVMD